MNENQTKILNVNCDEDVIIARQTVRKLMEQMGYSMLEQTRLITALSELARNMVVYAGSGEITIIPIAHSSKNGIKLVFQDNGPGIDDIEKAMEEGFSSTGSLGLGLSGSKRLVDEFEIESTPGKGTKVQITKWL